MCTYNDAEGKNNKWTVFVWLIFIHEALEGDGKGYQESTQTVDSSSNF